MKVPENLDRFETLVAIMAQLRAPEGCPWDRKQTHASIRENLLEETYEVLEAIDLDDPARLREELGDLLMQIVFHAGMAAEAGQFNIGDVIRGISEKLVYRHPHIFGSVRVGGAEEVALNWEALKQAEREEGASRLAGVPASLPALAYSQSIQRRAARAGFDWPDTSGVIEKVAEEVGEIQSAAGDEERAREFGDLLFTLVNFARRMGIESEAALREANRRFYRRFTRIEELARERGKQLDKLTLAQLDELWEEAKKDEAGDVQ